MCQWCSDDRCRLCLHTDSGCRKKLSMANGIINHDFSGQIEAVSAGTSPHDLNPKAMQAIAEIGIDIGTISTADYC